MDCGVGGKHYPLEFNNFKLQDIARALTKPFGVNVRFDADDSAIFGKAKLDIGQPVFDFLSNLAMQRGTLVSNTKDGDLHLYDAASVGSPVETIDGALNPAVVVTPWFNGQQSWYSEITGFSRTKKGRIGTSHTALNPHAGSVYRPFAFEAQDTEAADLPAATEACLSRMLGSAMGVTVDVAGWRTSAGKLWETNQTVMLVAPDAMIYTVYEFLIAGVVRRQSANQLTTSLALVIPGAYTGQVPDTLPWAEPSTDGRVG
jgi:prophage tail gpP-like protein